MEKDNKVYEAIRELILLGFFTNDNFDIPRIFLGEYQYEGKLYRIYTARGAEDKSIFIKCGDESLHLMIEDDVDSRRYGGPTTNDVYLYINKYKNIDFDDVACTYKKEKLNQKNIIFKSKIKLDYSLSLYMYINPNGFGIHKFKGKRFIFNHPEYFDKKLNNQKCIEIFKDEFSPDIILNLINQIYPNFEQIHINNKIDRLINSLSQDELVVLKERLLIKEKSQLVKKLTQTK